MNHYHHTIGVGATDELSLRVSVASLVRVLFKNPQDGQIMLALERTATLREKAGIRNVTVSVKPFGGGVRLTNPELMKKMIGNFHYDSERSRREKDFRIQIAPSSWEMIKNICRDQKIPEYRILDDSPERELEEEFEDSLNVKITPLRYRLKKLGMIIHEKPEKTNSVRAPDQPTVRIYYLFEAEIVDSDLVLKIISNSQKYSDHDLQEIVWEDVRKGGKGRANGTLVLPFDKLKKLYHSLPSDRDGKPVVFGDHYFENNVISILG